MYHKMTLANGLRSMIVDMPHMESVALGVWIGIGGRFENKNNSGISHYLEHMIFKGTKTRSTRKIKESIEGIGGSLNGFTDEEMTCYFIKVPKKYLELGLDVLSDMIINPKLTKADLDKERGVIYEEIKMYKDRPDYYSQQLLMELLWPNHPLGMPLIGNEKTLEKMDRTHLIDFKEKYYSPENIVVCACGQIDKDAFSSSVEKHFARLKKKTLPHYKKFQAKQKKPCFNFCERKTEQTHINLGFHSTSRFNPDKYTSKLLHILVGGNMSSRLFHEVREKRGLAYEISTGVKHYLDTGAFIINVGVDNKKVAKCVEVITKELKKIKNNRISEGEFRRAKDFYKGQLSMGLEDTLNRMIWIGEKLIAKDINYNADEIIDSIDMVTQDMVLDLAKKTFRSNNMNAAAVGPLSKKDQKRIKMSFKL